jgi:cysteinyl-tRNA synthetase
MHNGFLQVEGEKMAKSLGNFVTIRELMRGWKGSAWPGSAIRWAMLQTHYRQPIDWSFDLLYRSATEIVEILNLLRGNFREGGDVNYSRIELALKNHPPSEDVVAALSDDLNTPETIAAIREKKSSKIDKIVGCVADLVFLGVIKESDLKYFSIFHGVNTGVRDREQALSLATDYQVARANSDVSFVSATLERFDQLGLRIDENSSELIIVTTKTGTSDFDETVRKLIDARAAARKAKNFAESDRIRDELAAMGVVVKDSKDGTTWEIAR